MSAALEGGSRPAAEGAAKLERMADLLGRVGLKRTQVFELIRKGEFPRPVKCGRASLFVSREVDAWIEERIRLSRGSGK